MFRIATGLVKFGARSALRALPREVRQPIRFVVSPVRTVRRAITPPLVRDAQRLVRQAANPVSAIARSIENSMWHGYEGEQAAAVTNTLTSNTLISKTADLITVSMDEPEIEIDYQCPFCSRPFVRTVPGYDTARESAEYGPMFSTVEHGTTLGYRLSFRVICPSCTGKFSDSIIFEFVPRPYVYRPIPVAEQVLNASFLQMVATALIASFLLAHIDNVLFGFLAFLGPFFGVVIVILAVLGVIEHRFAELREKRNSSRLLRSIIIIATASAPLGAIFATFLAVKGWEIHVNTALIAFGVQILVVTPISQTLACYPLEKKIKKLQKTEEDRVQKFQEAHRKRELFSLEDENRLLMQKYSELMTRDGLTTVADLHARLGQSLKKEPEENLNRDSLNTVTYSRERAMKNKKLCETALKELSNLVDEITNSDDGSKINESNIRESFDAVRHTLKSYSLLSKTDVKQYEEIFSRLAIEVSVKLGYLYL